MKRHCLIYELSQFKLTNMSNYRGITVLRLVVRKRHDEEQFSNEFRKVKTREKQSGSKYHRGITRIHQELEGRGMKLVHVFRNLVICV